MEVGVIFVLLIYVSLSLLLGGAAATYEIWSPPTMLDRADGRGKFPSPKVGAVGIALFVAILWPALGSLLILDMWSARR